MVLTPMIVERVFHRFKKRLQGAREAFRAEIIRQKYNKKMEQQVSGDLPSYITSRAFLYALGDWAGLERLVEVYLWTAIGADYKIGACITREIQSIRAKLNIIEEILAEKGASAADLKQIRVFRSNLEGMTRERNRFIHDPHKVEDFSFRTMSSKHLDTGYTDRQPDYFLDFSDKCRQKSAEFNRMCNSIFPKVGLDALPEIPLPPPPSTKQDRPSP